VLSLVVNEQPVWVVNEAQHDALIWLGCNLLQILNLCGWPGAGLSGSLRLTGVGPAPG